ncbi:MAG: hypothetical protein ABEK50_10840 [bacterium]
MKYQDKVRKTQRTRSTSTRLGDMTSWVKRVLRSRGSNLSFRSLLLVLMAIFLGGALACQVIWQHVRYSRNKQELRQLANQNRELQLKIDRKKLVVSRLERLERIQRIAVNELGMKPLDDAPVLEMSQSQWVQSPREGGEPMVP